MYGFGEHRNLPQKRGDTETMPHVARELSWELARYLEAQDSPEDASAASNSAGGRPGWTRDEERLAGRGRDPGGRRRDGGQQGHRHLRHGRGRGCRQQQRRRSRQLRERHARSERTISTHLTGIRCPRRSVGSP